MTDTNTVHGGAVARAKAWLDKQGVQTLHADHPAVLINNLLRHIQAHPTPQTDTDAREKVVEAVEWIARRLHADRFPDSSWSGGGTKRSYWRRQALAALKTGDA